MGYKTELAIQKSQGIKIPQQLEKVIHINVKQYNHAACATDRHVHTVVLI